MGTLRTYQTIHSDVERERCNLSNMTIAGFKLVKRDLLGHNLSCKRRVDVDGDDFSWTGETDIDRENGRGQ